MTFYLKDLAADFHSYYNAERFLVDDVPLRRARLLLAAAAGQVVQQRARRARHRRAGADVTGRATAIPQPRPVHDSPVSDRTQSSPDAARGAHSRKSGVGGTLVGLFIGIALGLGLAAGVAFYLMKAGNPYQPSVARKDAGRDGSKEPAQGRKADARRRREAALRFLQDPAGRREPKRRKGRGALAATRRPSSAPLARTRRSRAWRTRPAAAPDKAPAKADGATGAEIGRAFLAAGRLVRHRRRRREPEGAARAVRLGGVGAAGDAARQERALPRAARPVRQRRAS